MESNSVCNHTSHNKIGRPRSGSTICLSRYDSKRYKILLPINHKNYNFQERKNSQVMTERDNLSDWSIELSDNKLSDNNLASELVENSSFF